MLITMIRDRHPVHQVPLDDGYLGGAGELLMLLEDDVENSKGKDALIQPLRISSSIGSRTPRLTARIAADLSRARAAYRLRAGARRSRYLQDDARRAARDRRSLAAMADATSRLLAGCGDRLRRA